MSTQAKILNLLNRRAYTVIELAQALGMTRNSAYLQVTRLEAAGLIEKKEQRRSDLAGKPAFEYQTAVGSEDTFSQAYKPLIGSIVEVLEKEVPLARRKKIFAKAGEEMAVKAGLPGDGDINRNVELAVNVLNSLGALAEVEEQDGQMVLSSFSCPVATSVRADTETCNLVSAFLSKATSCEVMAQCKRQGNLVCQFVIRHPSK